MILKTPEIISLSINSAVFLTFTIAAFFLVNKINLQEKGYKYLFWLYTVFWIPVMLVRSYSSKMEGGIDPTKTYVPIVLASYGIVGIFIRLFADSISYLFKYRKAFLYFSVFTELVLIIPITINPTTTTNIISSVGIGIGASCIGSFELLFKEQYGNRKAFLTVSVLSIPPLLADFLTAPLQSIAVTLSTDSVTNKVNPNLLKYMWVVAIAFLVVAFVMLIFLKEKRMEVPLENKKIQVKSIFEKSFQQNLWMFIFLCFVGSIITFVKFSNSGAIATTHISNLGNIIGKSTKPYEGYLSVAFSSFQLIAGVSMGIYLIRKLDVISIFLIGAGSWMIFIIATSFISNPIAYIFIHTLNGFGYGILYNLMLALVLKITIDNKLFTKMGIYQSILSIGISVSGPFSTWIKKTVIGEWKPLTDITINKYMKSYLVQNMVLLSVVVATTLLFTLVMYFVNKNSDSFTLNKKESENEKIFKSKINTSQTKIVNQLNLI